MKRSEAALWIIGIITFLVWCLWACAARADNLTDLRDLPQGGAACSNWNVDGYPVGWHISRVQAGHHVLPAVKLFPPDLQSRNGQLVPDVKAILADPAWSFMANGCPLVLRSNNLQQSLFDGPAQIFVNGAKVIDRFSDPAIWWAKGLEYRQSPQVQALKKLAPAAYVVWQENAEAGDDKPTFYVTGNVAKLQMLWLPNALSLNPRVPVTMDPVKWIAKSGLIRQQQYAALYAALDLWPLYTAGYNAVSSDAHVARPPADFDAAGYSPQGLSYDWAEASEYRYPGTPFTSPAILSALNLRPVWKDLKRRNPRSGRNLLVYLQQDAARQYGITPERWEGYVQWLYWSLREPGSPLVLTYWNKSQTKPTDLFFSGDTSGPTEADYFAALENAADRCMSEETTTPFRDFFLNGNIVRNPDWHHPDIENSQNLRQPPYPRPEDDDRNVFLFCDANTPYAQWFKPTTDGKKLLQPVTVNVWALATELNGRYLVYAWSPTGTAQTVVTVPGAGDFGIDFGGKAWGFWLIEPPQGWTVRKVQ